MSPAFDPCTSAVFGWVNPREDVMLGSAYTHVLSRPGGETGGWEVPQVKLQRDVECRPVWIGVSGLTPNRASLAPI